MTRAGVYPALVGLTIGCLVAGVVVPFAVGEGRRPVATTAGSAPTDVLPGGASGAADGPLARDVGATGSAGAVDPSAPGSDGPTTTPATGGAAGPITGTASDPAQPPIKLGFVLLDLGSSGGLGFDFGLDPEQQERAIRALVDATNEQGGLAGHRIEPAFATFNVLDTLTGGDSGRAVCLKLTEDDRVFAVVGYLFPADQLCVTREHRTPMLSDAANNLDSTFAASEGRLLSIYPRAGHLMESFVAFADGAGLLRGRGIGIVGEAANDPAGEVSEALANHLRRAGHRVTRITRLSADLSQGASQMPVEVNQQRTAGSEVVVLLTNPLYVQQFSQQAESQGWRPRYAFSDFANGTTDPANDMPESLDGALGVAGAFPGTGTSDTTGFPEPAAAVSCREEYERRTGQRLPARGSGDNKYSITIVACDDFRILRELAAAAGPGLTQASFIAAADRVGTVEGLARIPGGSYRPGKRDLADHARLSRYDSTCQCFHPDGPFRRTR